jgi:hypothetical protein
MRHIRKTLIIHRVVQIVLIALLLYMALHFQQTSPCDARLNAKD